LPPAITTVQALEQIPGPHCPTPGCSPAPAYRMGRNENAPNAGGGPQRPAGPRQSHPTLCCPDRWRIVVGPIAPAELSQQIGHRGPPASQNTTRSGVPARPAPGWAAASSEAGAAQLARAPKHLRIKVVANNAARPGPAPPPRPAAKEPPINPTPQNRHLPTASNNHPRPCRGKAGGSASSQLRGRARLARRRPASAARSSALRENPPPPPPSSTPPRHSQASQ